jgi:hypothetical protein
MTHKVLPLILLSVTFSLIVACSPNVEKDTISGNTQELKLNAFSLEETASVKHVQSHLEFLADDLLEGREAGTRGYDIAALYIAKEFAKYGLYKAGDDQSYFQNIFFRASSPVLASPKLTFEGASGGFSLSSPAHFITFANTVSENAYVSAPLVFAGYGIVSKEYEIDDYAGLDVKGKIVVMLRSAPQYLPSEEGAHLGSRKVKVKLASDRGAIGVLWIHTPEFAKVATYQQYMVYRTATRLAWLDTDKQPGNSNSAIKGIAHLSQQATKQLFEYAPTNIESIYQQLDKDQLPQGFDIPLVATLSSQSEHVELISPNVVGIIEGSDPTLKHEYIVYSVHLDHTGIARSVLKDKINNGAMDNAIGSSILLETARMFASLPTKPKRSILFVALTAEETGLLGSQYFARFPTVPKDSMVANINMDMPILTYDFSTVIAFGAQHSSIGKAVQQASESLGMKMIPDPYPEQSNFTRSDHYSFVEQGIPSVYLNTGTSSFNPDDNVEEIRRDFLANYYHKPIDDASQSFNWHAVGRFTSVNYRIGLILANQEAKPRWNKNNFFAEKFAKEQD